MTTHIKTCLICETQVETKVEAAPDWYHNDSGILLRIYCNEICRDYLIAATPDKSGKVWVEKSTQTLLNVSHSGFTKSVQILMGSIPRSFGKCRFHKRRIFWCPSLSLILITLSFSQYRLPGVPNNGIVPCIGMLTEEMLRRLGM